MPFTGKVLAALRARASTGKLLTSEHARQILGYTAQRWYRLAALTGFPEQRHLSRSRCVHPGKLADFLEFQNRLHAGVSLTEAALMCHTTAHTLRRVIAAGEFVPVLGRVNDRPRFGKDAVRAWQLARERGEITPRELTTPSNGHPPT